MSDSSEQRHAFSGPRPGPPASIKTATDAIRARVWSVWRRGNFAGLSRDHQIAIADLEGFATGQKARLPEAAMRALVKEFYPHNVSFDAERDLLIDTSPPPMKAGIVPEPYQNPDPTIQKAHDAYLAALAAARPPEPERPKPVAPAESNWLVRPGFARRP